MTSEMETARMAGSGERDADHERGVDDVRSGE